MLRDTIKKVLTEVTGDVGGRGSYIAPLMPGVRLFDKSQLAPFTDSVSKYDNAELEYDSYDGKMDKSKKEISKMEKNAIKIAKHKKNHPTQSDDDGDILNQYPEHSKKLRQKDTSKPFIKFNEWVEIKNDDVISESGIGDFAGEYSGPMELGMKKWKDSELGPFTKFSKIPINKIKVKKKIKNNIKRTVGMWEKGKDGTYNIDTHDTHTINEDLAVWFGTKKKPKGSKQPKGPWVNICKKVDGKHPPCGRPEATDKSYPKCRAAGVAGKMSDSQKKAACAQKRNAEKSHSKTGTGNKPKMVSYKPKKKQNESLERLIKKILNEQSSSATTQTVNTNIQCVPASIQPFLMYLSKNKNIVKQKLGIDDSRLIMLAKAAVGIIGRESSFENSLRYSLKSVLNTFGIGGSFGPAQMKKETWNELGVTKTFGLSDTDLSTILGAGLGAMMFLNRSYNKALSEGYTTDKSSNIDGTGNSALDVSIASYNAGMEKIAKYCKNPNEKLAHKCNSEEKNILKNYIPNFPTDKLYTGNLSTHGYVKEVASYYKKFTCIDSI